LKVFASSLILDERHVSLPVEGAYHLLYTVVLIQSKFEGM
jgi:hypothetical protein